MMLGVSCNNTVFGSKLVGMMLYSFSHLTIASDSMQLQTIRHFILCCLSSLSPSVLCGTKFVSHFVRSLESRFNPMFTERWGTKY